MGTIYGKEYKDHLTGLFPKKTLYDFNRIRQDFRMTLLNFSLWRMEEPWEVAPRQIDDTLLWIVRKGKFSCTVDGRPQLLGEGEGFAAPEGIQHAMAFAPGCREGAALVIHLKLRGYLTTSPFAALREHFFKLISPEAFFRLVERAIALKSISAEAAGQTVTSQVFELIYDWVAEGRLLPDKMGVCDARIREALNFIYRNLSGNIGVADIAGSVGLHEVRFREIFREQTGMTPLGCLKQARLERVSELLIKTLKPLAEIAELTGFNTPSYLCSAFRAYSGMSPQAYRKVYQQRYQE